MKNQEILKSLSPRTAYMIANGVNMLGNYEETFRYIFEGLYVNESDSVEQFCKWLQENKHRASREIPFVESNFINLYENHFLKQTNNVKEPILIKDLLNDYLIDLSNKRMKPKTCETVNYEEYRADVINRLEDGYGSIDDDSFIQKCYEDGWKSRDCAEDISEEIAIKKYAKEHQEEDGDFSE